MWKSIRDPELLAAYRRELPGPPDAAIESLLVRLSSSPDTSQLHVVTSHGHVRLTLASDYTREEEYGSLHLGKSGDSYFVSHVEKRARQASASRVCAREDLPSVIELYLLRLLNES